MAGGFEQAVNIALGLPYLARRGRPRHALDIAGKGVADPSSLAAAVAECARVATQRPRARGLMDTIGFDDFLKVELRVGRVLSAEAFAQARKPPTSCVDFGPELGVRASPARR